ncbi:gliding motility-associated C-terminal domain-containing protein [Flavobacterium qiangtangense]|uniref:Gliding motility-associated C-terminal domain-containing protein n=1 Tax=Flavobacterium qiangtangense TaxID=1442595 RepID=A0ABW1PL35_9FLAO
MKFNFTFPRMYGYKYVSVLLLLLFYHINLEAQVSRVYASEISAESNTDVSSNAIDGNLTTSASVSASSGLALGIGAYSGYVELQYPTLLPANTTSYVKIQTDDNLLPSLLGGSLGGLLSDVLGGVLIGNQEFTVQAKNNNNVLLQGDSQDIGEFATERLRIITDETGDFYIAITPAAPYNRIRVRNRLGSVLGLFNTRALRVFESFYVSGNDPCGYGAFTSFSGSGLNLDLLGLGGAGVTNPQNVLDADPNSFSRLSLGILSVAGSIQQTIYFEGLSQSTEEFNIRLKVDPSLLALGVANNIQVVAYNGPTVVETRNISTLLNLDLLTLLQGNQIATIPFAPIAPADRITVRYNSLLNVQLTQSLDLYDVVRVPKVPVLTAPASQNATICSGSTVTLTATTAPGNEIRYYASATATTPLITVASGAPYQTAPITASTILYVAAAKVGCSEESRRVPIPITVITVPTADNITIPSTLTACQGAITLNPTSTIAGATIRYYKDQNKTVEIVSGFSGDPGVTYIKNPTTGALTITGLTAVNSPYNYFISLTVNGLCENAANTLKQVTVNFGSTLSVPVNPNLVGCGSVNLANAILNFDPTATYVFYNSASVAITPAQATNITASGNYFIQQQNVNSTCISDLVPVAVTVNPQPTLVIANTALVTQIGNSVTLNATSTGTIVWFNSTGTALGSNVAGPFTTAGTFTFTAVATLGTCSISGTVTVTVVDPASCPPLTERNFADTQRWGSIITGNVSNPGNAVDGNLQTFSTITTGLGLLGIGTTFQILEWNETIPAGTPVTLKLGSEYSGVTLIGGYSVVGTKRNASGVPVDVGTLQSVSGSLLNLLPGQNNFEYTFVPANGTGPQAYDGVRIQVASLVSLAQSAKVYEAYYEVPAAQIACGPDAEDVLFGAIDLGVGALTTTVGVTNAVNAIDNSQTSFATMFTGVGVLTAAELTVIFRTPSVVGDTLTVRISQPANLLNLNALAGLSFQPLLNEANAGPVFTNSSLLNLELLGGGAEAILTFVPTQSFDRLRIRFGGVANVLDQLRVHDVRRTANTQVANADPNNAITACQGETITLQAASVPCTTFVWYDAETGGNVVATGNSFTIPSDLAEGVYTYYIQPIRFGCEAMARGPVTVTVTETAAENAIASVQINGGTDTSFCAPTGAVSLTAVLNSTVTLTNPIFYWYSLTGTTQTLVPGQTGATLNLTNLAPGTYTYFVGVSSSEFCQTAVADRVQVTFTIQSSSLATDILIDDETACLNSTAVLAPTSTLANPVFSYYFTNDTTQPITNSTVLGVTYTVNADGTLSISGLLPIASPYTYYVAVTSDTTCLNTAGNLQAVTVTVGNPPAPTTDSMTQTFCQANNPTVADLQVNEPNVVFYTLPVGGVPLATTTPLTPGLYYAAQIDGDCESDDRLVISVIIGNPATPTTLQSIQTFCAINNPTVANIQVNEANVVFYDALLAGNLIPLTTPLINGTYYAAIQDGSCESEIRLAITVIINNPLTPTTDNTSQVFCAANNPTVADLEVNEANVVYFNVPTGGTALAPTTPLTNGIYYISQIDGIGCQSSVRLAITVTITVVGTPTTTSTDQNFCQSDNPTVANIQVNQTGVIFYDALVGGNLIASTAPLTAGVYYASLLNGICESEARLAITVTITNPLTPTTPNQTQTFCQIDSPTVADLLINETSVAVFTSITGGTALLSTDLLVSGTYYVAALDGLCQSVNRLAITVIINDPAAPTTSDTTQDFCQAENPTVADLLVNETGVIFYTTLTGGTPLLPTVALTNGIYYAAIVDVDGCESIERLAITVTITVVGNPTTDNTTQNFCQIDNPTVADIQVNQTGAIFYDALVGGNLIASTTPLTAGVYYAALVNGVCESEVRLAITVTISNPSAPTTTETTQTFCQIDNPTVADLDVNETTIAIYTQITGGTALLPTDALVSGTYYVALLDGICESIIRLQITVIVNDPAAPTTLDTTQDFCQAENPTVADLQVNETSVVFYNVPTGGTPLASTDALTNGVYYVAFLDGTGCESDTRLAITVTITVVGTPTTTSTTQNFCQGNNPTVANIQVNETGVVFYSTPTGGTIIPSTTPLVPGIYYVAIQNGVCESEARLAITVTISNPSAPTTLDTTQDFCQNSNPTVADLDVNETTIAIYTQITGGTALLPTDTLVSGTYYVALLDGICESINRLAITVIVNDPVAPTTLDTTQDFCQAENPTVADLQVNETSVVFYNVPTGGTPLASTDALTNGVYYVAFLDGTGCESDTRLAITVTITVVGTPTTTSTTQNFCQGNNPTVANIQVNETGVVFYSTPTGGTIIPSTTPLVPEIYYVAIQNGVCESEARLAITVTISNPSAPTTLDTTQDFCQNSNPTVANLQVNEANVVFYTTATGGTALPPTTPLTNGVYYASILDGTCESASRLAITVTITNLATPTTADNTQDFCQADGPTVADLQVNETNVVFYNVATGGTPIASTTPLTAGTYYVALTDGTCESGTRLAITVTFLADGLAEITGGGTEACFSQAVTYTTVAGMTDYVWDVTGGNITAGGQLTDNFATVTWTTVATGNISVTFTNTTGCSSDNFATRDINVTVCSDITITKTVDNFNPNIDDNVTFTITVTNAGQSNFTDIIVNEALPSGYQYVSSNASVGNYSPILGTWTIPTLTTGQTATLQIVVKVLATGDYMNMATIATSNPPDSDGENNIASAWVEPTCLVVYNEFSPNNDGDNDFFRIDCIENYPNNTLQVHNRYGVEVYRTRAYQNTWDGTANVNSPINQDNKLPTGTYYYILDMGDGSGTKTGWIYLIR